VTGRNEGRISPGDIDQAELAGDVEDAMARPTAGMLVTGA
jgi:hypothetical protein